MSNYTFSMDFKTRPWQWWAPIVILFTVKMLFKPTMPWYIIFMPLAIQVTFLVGFMLLAYAFMGFVMSKAIAKNQIKIVKVEP